jgi:hypothetical protein
LPLFRGLTYSARIDRQLAGVLNSKTPVPIEPARLPRRSSGSSRTRFDPAVPFTGLWPSRDRVHFGRQLKGEDRTASWAIAVASETASHFARSDGTAVQTPSVAAGARGESVLEDPR